MFVTPSSISSIQGGTVNVLNRCLDSVMGCRGANTLKLNPVKTEMLFIGGAVLQGVGMQHVLERVEFYH